MRFTPAVWSGCGGGTLLFGQVTPVGKPSLPFWGALCTASPSRLVARLQVQVIQLLDRLAIVQPQNNQHSPRIHSPACCPSIVVCYAICRWEMSLQRAKYPPNSCLTDVFLHACSLYPYCLQTSSISFLVCPINSRSDHPLELRYGTIGLCGPG